MNVFWSITCWCWALDMIRMIKVHLMGMGHAMPIVCQMISWWTALMSSWPCVVCNGEMDRCICSSNVIHRVYADSKHSYPQGEHHRKLWTSYQVWADSQTYNKEHLIIYVTKMICWFTKLSWMAWENVPKFQRCADQISMIMRFVNKWIVLKS